MSDFQRVNHLGELTISGKILTLVLENLEGAEQCQKMKVKTFETLLGSWKAIENKYKSQGHDSFPFTLRCQSWKQIMIQL